MKLQIKPKIYRSNNICIRVTEAEKKKINAFIQYESKRIGQKVTMTDVFKTVLDAIKV